MPCAWGLTPAAQDVVGEKVVFMGRMLSERPRTHHPRRAPARPTPARVEMVTRTMKAASLRAPLACKRRWNKVSKPVESPCAGQDGRCARYTPQLCSGNRPPHDRLRLQRAQRRRPQRTVDPPLARLRRLTRRGRCRPRLHHLPGRAALPHWAGRRPARAARAAGRGLQRSVERRPHPLDQRHPCAVALFRRASSWGDDGGRRRPSLRPARGPGHRRHRHPRSRGRRHRWGAPARLRRHGLELPRHGERAGELPAPVAAALRVRAGAGGPLPPERTRGRSRAGRLHHGGGGQRRRRGMARRAAGRQRRDRRRERRGRRGGPVDASFAAAPRRPPVDARLRPRRPPAGRPRPGHTRAGMLLPGLRARPRLRGALRGRRPVAPAPLDPQRRHLRRAGARRSARSGRCG